VFLSGPLTISLLAVAAGVALDVGLPHTSVALHWVEGLVVAVPCLWLVVRAVRWRTTSLVVTSARVIELWGVASRRLWERRFSQIESVAVEQPLVRRLLGTGRLELHLWDEERTRRFEDVRKPVVLRRVIVRRLVPPGGPGPYSPGPYGPGPYGPGPY
jgi:hypothetical protein